MCFLLTKSAGGNEAVALFNATFGNLFGVIYTPALILLLFGSHTSIDTVSAIEEIALTVLVPIIVGQLIQRIEIVQRKILKPYGAYIGPFGKIILLVLAFTVFCDTFSTSHSSDEVPIPSGSLGVIIPLTIILYGLIFVLALKWFAWSKWPGAPFRRADQIAAWFTGTHKTLALGIPIIQILFAGDPQIGLITIPLLIYHPTELFSGSLMSSYIGKWYARNPDPDLTLDGAAPPSVAAAVDLQQLNAITNDNTNPTAATAAATTSTVDASDPSAAPATQNFSEPIISADDAGSTSSATALNTLSSL